MSKKFAIGRIGSGREATSHISDEVKKLFRGDTPHLPFNNMANFGNLASIRFDDGLCDIDNECKSNTEYCKSLVSPSDEYEFVTGFNTPLIIEMSGSNDHQPSSFSGQNDLNVWKYISRLEFDTDMCSYYSFGELDNRITKWFNSFGIKYSGSISSINGIWLGSGKNRLTTSLMFNDGVLSIIDFERAIVFTIKISKKELREMVISENSDYVFERSTGKKVNRLKRSWDLIIGDEVTLNDDVCVIVGENNQSKYPNDKIKGVNLWMDELRIGDSVYLSDGKVIRERDVIEITDDNEIITSYSCYSYTEFKKNSRHGIFRDSDDGTKFGNVTLSNSA